MREYEFSISSGGQQARTVQGNFVRIKSASDEINVKVENKEGRIIADLNLSGGMRFRVPDIFHTLRVANNNAGSVNAVLVAGVGDVDDTEISGNVTVAGSDTIGTSTDVSLAATSTTIISAANASRREILITNLTSNSEYLRVGDSNAGAARGTELAPGQTVSLSTSAAVYAYNPGAAAQSVSLLEVL